MVRSTPSPRHVVAVIALFAAGGVLAWGVKSPSVDALSWVPLGAAIVAVLLPSVRAAVARAYERLNATTPRHRLILGMTIWVTTSLYLAWTAWQQDRIFHPLWHDERSYIILARLIASGRLWGPMPPCAESFESIYILVKPVYTSMYFVGPGLLYAPVLLLQAPPWLMAVSIAGLMAAVLFRIVSEMLNPAAGLVGALALIAPVAYRQQSIRIMAHQPVMLMLLICLLSWIYWSRGPKLRWMVVLGLIGGWAMTTRPLDASIGLAPIALLVISRLRQCSWRVRAATILTAAACATPFYILQIVSNYGVTGSWHRTAWEIYNSTEYPNSTLGFHPPDPTLHAASSLPQKQWLYEHFYKPQILNHQPHMVWHEFWTNRRGDVARSTLPHPWMIALLPIALLGLRDRTRVALAVFAPAYVAAYTFYYWLPPHYAMVVGPAMVFLLMLAIRQLAMLWAGRTSRIESLLLFVLLGLCIGRLPEFTRQPDEPAANTLLESAVIEERLSQIKPPALVLIRWSPEMSAFVEPVYQLDSPRPDDAPIVRAHDLGPEKNAALIRHYARVNPDRVVWRYDRPKVVEENEEGLLVRLGTAGELAKRLPE